MINLADNTNRWGSAPSASAALRAGVAPRDYPSPFADELKAEIAQYVGVLPGGVTTACGSDGVLVAALRAFAAPGGRIVIPEPTFQIAPRFARSAGLDVVTVPLTERYDLDVTATLAARPDVVYLCSPNNPLGACLSAERVSALAEATDALVIVDEAYAEFAAQSMVPLVDRAPNVVVVRTMSKAFGLAGVRVGYAVGASERIARIEEMRGPYQVSAPGIAAACAALRDDVPWMQQCVQQAAEARALLASELARRGLEPLPSSANFVLIPMSDAPEVALRLRERGVAVRMFQGLRAVSAALASSAGNALRVTVGPRDQMDAFMNALDASLQIATCV